ncbi:hypothetical protein QFC22_006718 [Naganishia vaughanmartiniae]|uniref:Uncharacterized protein n=1 Tax=Naganishia vaughanmartiniae TaxID=1424756 RepID=A0ACC2WGG4_9TREE|nr:hypothetical protein QFC22_006718 [Naganishia vaughanmartiniae]
MECQVRSRDGSGDVRDEFGIQDGFNAFITPINTISSRATAASNGDRALVGSEPSVNDPSSPTSPEGNTWPQFKEKDPNEIGFDGPDDPDDPFNMPVWRKWVIVISIASASTCVTCASSMAASTYAGLQKSYHISEEVAILTVFVRSAALLPRPCPDQPF